MNKCIKCTDNIYVTEKEIEEGMRKVIESGVPIADKSLYLERLKTCKSCERLVFGTTCMSCGCIVKIRALNALRICPHESGSKW